MNEIVNQHNELIDLPLRKFNASEIDIFTALCYKCNEKNTHEVQLKFDDIKQLAHYRNKNAAQFIKDLNSTNRKLRSLEMRVGNERRYTDFVLFPTFTTDLDEETLTIKVAEEFAYLLNDLSKNYTSLELQQSSRLKSAYSKAIYKKLRKFRDTGKWIVDLVDFREYLDVPKSFKQTHIDERVIAPALTELTPYFENLKCKKKYQKGGRGRPKVVGYEWTFTAQENEAPAITQEEIAKKNGWFKTVWYCPKCKRQMFSKMMINENGPYTMYGHTDWKTGGCDYWTNDVTTLLQLHQIEQSADAEPEAPEETQEQIENKSKLSSLLSGIFGK